MRATSVCATLLLALVLASSAAAQPPAASEIEFKAHDGHVISADYFAPKPQKYGAPIVILLHMYRHDRTTWQPLIGPLHEAGFAVLALDMRGHGRSATPATRERVMARETKLFEDMTHDVRGAYDWLAKREGLDRSRFALVGASVGCSVALRYAREDRSVDAVVCMTPGLRYLGLDSSSDLRATHGRHVLLLATADEREACDKLAPLMDGAEARVIDDARAHGTQMFGRVPGVEALITDFLAKSVGKPSAEQVYGSISGDVYHKPDAEWVDTIEPSDLRVYSSPQEARQRGVRESKTKGPDRPNP